LLQPVPGDRHKVGPIRCTEEIAVRLHQASGIDPADSVKRFPKERGIPLYLDSNAKTVVFAGRSKDDNGGAATATATTSINSGDASAEATSFGGHGGAGAASGFPNNGDVGHF